MIWPFSKIRYLKTQLELQYEFNQKLVRYLDEVTGNRHINLGFSLFVVKPDGMFEVKEMKCQDSKPKP